MPSANPVELLGNLRGPYGDAFFNPQRPGSYHKTQHGIVTEAGFMPFFAETKVDYDSVIVSTPPVEWVNDVSSPYSAIGPVITIIGGVDALSSWENIVLPTGAVQQVLAVATGGIVEDQASIALALHSDGSTTPRIFVARSGGGSGRTRPFNSSSYGALTGTPSAVDGFLSENGNLWAIIAYQARKWPAGTNPVTGTAHAAIDVGTSTWDITGAGLLSEGRVCFIKADGIYPYDTDTEEFRNIYAGLARNPHPDTGKGTITWGADMYVPISPRGLVRVTPDLDVLGVSPLPLFVVRSDFRTPGRYKLGALAGDDQALWAVTEPFNRRIGAEISLKVFTTKNDGASFADRSSVCTDDDPSTLFDFNDLSPVTTRAAIYVGGVSVRFLAPWLKVQSSDNPNDDFTLQYWDGDSWEDVAAVDYTADFKRTGPWLPNAKIPNDWTANEVNSVTGYWLRLTATTVDDVDTEISEVRVLPEAADLPEATAAGVTEAWEEDVDIRTHLLRGYPAGDGFFWDDVGSIRGDYSRGLIFSRVKAAGSGRQLFAFGPAGYARFGVGASGSPAGESYPDCVNGFTSLLFLPADDRITNDTRAPQLKKGIEYIELQGRDFNESDDVAHAWVRMDGGSWHYYGSAKQLPNRLVIAPRAETAIGYEYEVLVGLQDTTQDERVPSITRIIAGVFDVAGTAIDD